VTESTLWRHRDRRARRMWSTRAAAKTGTDLEEERRATERERRLARRRRYVAQLQGEGLIGVLAVVVVIMWLSSPYFLTSANLLTAASVVSVLG